MIGPLEAFVLLFIYLLPAWLVARYAARKGQSFGLFLLLGLLVSWIISLIVALVAEDKGTAAQGAAPEPHEQRSAPSADLPPPSPTGSASTAPESPPVPASSAHLDALERLNALKVSGGIDRSRVRSREGADTQPQRRHLTPGRAAWFRRDVRLISVVLTQALAVLRRERLRGPSGANG